MEIGRSIHTMAYFDGMLDEVPIWNLARTPEQIAKSMNTRLTGNEEGLVAYYSFDEGAGMTAHDCLGSPPRRDPRSGARVGAITNSGIVPLTIRRRRSRFGPASTP